MTQPSPFARLAAELELDEFEVALMVAGVLESDLHEQAARRALDELATTFAGLPERSARTLCEFMRRAGFHGAADDYYGLENSCIDQVLERRRGIPITLAVLYLCIARRAGLAAVGINFPGHFLAEIDGALVDPFRGEVTGHDACVARLRQAGIGDVDAAFRPTNARDLALRMLNNARGVLTAGARWAEALEVMDHQQVLAPAELQLELERAELWVRAGAVDMAREVLTRAGERFRQPAQQREIARCLASLKVGRGPSALN